MRTFLPPFVSSCHSTTSSSSFFFPSTFNGCCRSSVMVAAYRHLQPVSTPPSPQNFVELQAADRANLDLFLTACLFKRKVNYPIWYSDLSIPDNRFRIKTTLSLFDWLKKPSGKKKTFFYWKVQTRLIVYFKIWHFNLEKEKTWKNILLNVMRALKATFMEPLFINF